MRYEIKGAPMPVVICEIEDGETVICEGGAMSWMTPNLKFETSGGGVGKVFGRLLSGEAAFQNRYTAKGGKGMIAFASSFPGDILAYEITPGKALIAQKKAFLASTEGVKSSVFFQSGIGKGLFGGEGFIMQKYEGSGVVFIEVDGSTQEYDLAQGEQLIIDTGHLAVMDATVSLDIQKVKGAKNILLGGEGLFNTVLTGPGKVLLQTMPLTNFAQDIASMIPKE